MTLVICALAAVICIVLRFAKPEWSRQFSIGLLALMFTGASLMWSMDLVFTLMEGELFIDLADVEGSMDDAFLGALVVVLGLAVWGVVNVIKGTRARKQLTA
jgi:hypothetical protein